MLLIFISFFKFDPCRLLQKVTSLLWVQITFLAVEVIGIVLLFLNCSMFLKWILFTISGIGKKGELKRSFLQIKWCKAPVNYKLGLSLLFSLILSLFLLQIATHHKWQREDDKWTLTTITGRPITLQINYPNSIFFPAHRFCFKLGIYLTLGVQEDHMAMRLIGHGNFFAVPAIMTLPSELVTKTADINHQLSI